MRIFLMFIMGMFMSKLSHSQSHIDSLLKKNANKKVAIADLEGQWYCNDSIHPKIAFELEGKYSLLIKPILDGVNYYRFGIISDSVYVKGTAANWPPYYCIINIIDKETVELNLYQFFSKAPFNLIAHRKEN